MSSIDEIRDPCSCSDITFLQDTWLLNRELSFGSTISTDVYSKGISSIDDIQNILQGRPYGGLGVPWGKSLYECKALDLYLF